MLVDKAGGMTSHDVVARMRRIAGTRKVGHAGTLDPMATGLLILGVNGATRLLHYLVGLDKEYLATIRLGQASSTDDAEGQLGALADAQVLAALTQEQILAQMARLTGDIEQVPSSVSAIKVDGRRAYARVRAGEDVALPARPVTVSEFVLDGVERVEGVIDVQVRVVCSSGTYIRALARDLGELLGVGGHLTSLRRTRVGGYSVTDAQLLEQIDPARDLVPASVAAAAALPVVQLSAQQAIDVGHGKRVAVAEVAVASSADTSGQFAASPAAAIDPGGRLVAVLERRGADWKVATGFPPEPATEPAAAGGVVAMSSPTHSGGRTDREETRT